MEGIEKILEQFPHLKRDILIPVLQAVQDEFGYLPKDAIRLIGNRMKLPTSKIYGLATFYNQFSFTPRGKYHFVVCNGTACYLDRSGEIVKEIEKNLGIFDGESTGDGLFSFEVQSCIGACGQSPVLSVNGTYYSGVDVQKVREIIENCKAEEG